MLAIMWSIKTVTSHGVQQGHSKKAYKVCETFTDRLQIELSELSDKQEKLGKFFGTDMFKGLSTQKQVLLRAQFGAMEAYRQILIERIRIEEIAKWNRGISY